MLRRPMRQTLVLSVLLGLGASSFAQPSLASAKTRQPRHSQPAHVKQSAPDITGSISKADSRASADAAKPVGVTATPDVLKPYYLPATSRAHMRECGERWRSKRMAGETGDDDWRDFATKCLATRMTADAPD